MQQVDAARWEAALPYELVTTTERGAVVDAMMSDVPVPDGLDVSEIRDRPVLSDRQTIGSELGEHVACAWLNTYLDATDASDQAGITAATEALGDIVKWGLFDESIGNGMQIAYDLPAVDPDDGSITIDRQPLTRDVAAQFCELGWG